MTDKTFNSNVAGASDKLVDMGDGTFAHRVAMAGLSLGCTAEVSFNRTADANAYTAGDVEGSSTSSGGAVLEFDFTDREGNAAPAGLFEILGGQLEIDVSAIPSGMTGYRLHLYNASPGSAFADNAAWTGIVSGDRASYKGFIDIGQPQALGTSPATLYVETNGINKPIVMPIGGKLYGYLVTNGGYTPASGTARKITLHGTPL